MLELKVRREPGGAVVIVDPDGDEHVANTPQQAWAVLTALTEQTQTQALVKQDKPPDNPRMKRRRKSGGESPGEPKTQVIRGPDAEPSGDIVGEVLARTGAAVFDGLKALGKGADYRHGSRRF